MQRFLEASEYVAQVRRSADAVRKHFPPNFEPEISLTLGSGLADLADQIVVHARLKYSRIHFPETSVEGHEGELIIGWLADVPMIGLSGRVHYYEVAHRPLGILYVVFATHVMADLGVKLAMTTNAVGGLNQDYRTGDLVVMSDHINFGIPNPLSGPHLQFGGNLYFQPQNRIHDVTLRSLFHSAAVAAKAEDRVHDGVYIAVPGRTFETAAEVRALRILGADTVGMSTVPELIAAANRGMQTLAISVVTNMTAADGTNATDHEEVMATLKDPDVRTRTTDVFFKFFERYGILPT